MTRNEIVDAALELPRDERVALGEELLSDGGFVPEVGEAWGDEIRRRLDEIDDGRVQLIPADEALALARQRLQEGRIRRAS